MMKAQLIFVVFLFIGLAVGLPLKEQEIDELIYRLQELKHQNGLSGNLYERRLDSIGGGNLLRSIDGHLIRNLDGIGGGNIVRSLDSLGGGNLLRNLDGIGGGNLVRSLDSLGGGNLLRNLDGIGGGNLLRSLDSLGGGNLLRNLDGIGGGNLVRGLDSLGGGNLLKRNVDSIGGGYLVKRSIQHSATKIGLSDKHRPNDSKSPLKKTTDLDRNHLLYDYYSTGISPTYGRQFDETSRLNGGAYQKRFDEIDRIGFNNLNRRSTKTKSQQQQLSPMTFSKREFDEIDRNGFDNFNKREFDEIDRIGFN